MVLKRLGVLTGGGDCPGLNTVIRAVTKTASQNGVVVYGFLDGFNGLVQKRYFILDDSKISGLLHKGGTILGTNNRDNPFHFPVGGKEDSDPVYEDCSHLAIQNLSDLRVEALIIIGGDGSLSVGRDLADRGVNIVGVPKTIDNDLASTEQTFGFDTAVTTATEALDKLHTTAESHHRVMVLEVMGRYAGWIALASGVAGGADVVLIPELPWKIENVARKILERRGQGKPFSIVVVAEGVKTPEGEMVVAKEVKGSIEGLRLGGIGARVGELIEKTTGAETRTTVLGHIQRGGSPSPFDRILATRFGVTACQLALRGIYGVMVSLQCGEIGYVPLSQATTMRSVPSENSIVAAARATGISFGDS